MTSADQSTKRLAESICATLIEEVRAGVLDMGAALPTERALGERFDASRPTVREAIALMQMRGYLVGGGGRRPVVSAPSLVNILRGAGEHIREILGDAESGAHLEQMRKFIETGAVREAVDRASNAEIAKLGAALERNFDGLGTADFAVTDIAFHRALVSIVGNPVILALHDMFVGALLQQRPRIADRLAHDRETYDEHRRIYEAIVAGDAATASAVMDQHLERSYRMRLPVPKALDDTRTPQEAAQG